MQAAGEWVLVFILAVSVLGIGPGKAGSTNPTTASQAAALATAQALQANTLELTGPLACPPGGCAAGQRIGMRYDFDFGGASIDAAAPNVRVCLYVTNSMDAGAATGADMGEASGQTYQNGSGCAPTITNYNLSGAREAALDPGTPDDALRFAFRLGAGGAGNGRAIARLFVRSGGAWTPVASASASSPILSIASPSIADPSYVANDSASCGSYSPCYVNSDGEESNGVGTGLKDAVDALPAGSSINVVGNYAIKITTVVVNKKITIAGVGNASITYLGLNSLAACDGAMLALAAPVTVRGLNIDDGNCTIKNRNLIEIDSSGGGSDPVLIESNDLTSGDNAIYAIKTNTDSLIVRFNQISSNAGSALYFEGDGSSNSALDIAANNITGNKGSPAINCAADATDPISNRKANHNYWGASSPSLTITHCAMLSAKRLGAPIAHNVSVPGVHADLVNVKDAKQYASGMGNLIGFERTGTGKDFNMYIVDHGYMISSGPPFSGLLGGESPSPCSNYWDVFLDENAAVSNNTLQLYIKYFDKAGKTPGCLAVINSTQYCDQTTTPAKYPLFWLDPSGDSITTWWDPVGAPPENQTDLDGQTTTCNIAANEIQVSIDGSGRPGLSDLGYTPFMVGIPVIKSFKPFASNQNVRIDWSTNNEPDISGFYILRGTDSTHLAPINGDIINHSGNASSGWSYSRTDSGRVNGETYYYRLQVVRTDGYSFYSAIYPILVNAATATSPPPTRTFTPVLPTRTRTLTRVPTNRPTQIPTRTFTPFKTRTATATRLVLPTLTRTLNVLTPGVQDTIIALSLTPKSTGTTGPEGFSPLESGTPGIDQTNEPNQTPGTAIAEAGIQTPQPAPSLTPAEVIAGSATGARGTPWLSLLLGLLAGLAMVGGAGGWWYYSMRK